MRLSWTSSLEPQDPLQLVVVHEHGARGLQRHRPRLLQLLRADGGVKGIFQSPHVEAAVPAGKALNHLLLVQLKNWLNGFEFSYQMAPGDLHTIVATYASANLFTYADAAWERYRLGEKYGITDPETGTPAIRNVFWPSRFGPNASRDPEDPQGFYQDTGIEALQQRGDALSTDVAALMRQRGVTMP